MYCIHHFKKVTYFLLYLNDGLRFFAVESLFILLYSYTVWITGVRIREGLLYYGPVLYAGKVMPVSLSVCQSKLLKTGRGSILH